MASKSQKILILYVGTESGGDQSFYEKLLATWEAKKALE